MSNSKSLPKWATPERKDALIQLFVDSGGFCVYGHKKCLIPEHHYHLYTELLIQDWKQLDIELSNALWQAERKALHSLGERTFPVRGQFSAISRDIYAGNQPLYYLDGQAVSGLTFTPFIRVRIASSYIRLYVDLGEALRLGLTMVGSWPKKSTSASLLPKHDLARFLPIGCPDSLTDYKL